MRLIVYKSFSLCLLYILSFTPIMALGIDVGGTKICVVVVEGEKIVEKEQYQTPRKEVIPAIRSIIQNFEEDKIGLAVPCYLRDGICKGAPNVRSLEGKRLRDYFRNAYIINDATAMAYGEYILRDGRYDPLLLVSLGTGVGGGLVIHGEPYEGRGSGMEIGHIKGFSVRRCDCGKIGCLETVLGGKYAGNLKEMYIRAKNGEEDALAFFEDYGVTLARGIAPAIQLLDPEIVVFGGSVSEAYEFFFPPLRDELQNLLSFITPQEIFFEKARDTCSAAFGAAVLAESHKRRL